MRTTRPLLGCLLLATGLLALPAQSGAETVYKPIPTQYIAALGDPGATSGVGADSMGPVARGSGSARRAAHQL